MKTIGIYNLINNKPDFIIYSIFIGGNDFLVLNPFFIFKNIAVNIDDLSKINDSNNKLFLLFNLPTLSDTPIANNIGNKILQNYIIPIFKNFNHLLKSFFSESVIEKINDASLILGSLVIKDFINILVKFSLNLVSRIYSNELEILSENLTAEGHRVLVIDITKFYNDLTLNLDDHGLNNDLECMVSKGCKNGLFYDDIHPSAQAHILLAEYISSTYSEYINT